MAESTKELTDSGAKVTTTVEGSEATASAPAEPSVKKGYWVIHILAIKNEETFFAHLQHANSKTKYGGKTRIFAPVQATLKGDPVAFCAVIEFPTVQAAIDCWDDPEDYKEARALLGDPETDVVDRRVCVIEADPLPELKLGQAFWINHVEMLHDQEKFWAYATASMPCFTSVTFGPIAHQHVGAGSAPKKMGFALVGGFESLQHGIDVYGGENEQYQKAREAGGMVEGEDHVVNRTICVIEYDPQYDQLVPK